MASCQHVLGPAVSAGSGRQLRDATPTIPYKYRQHQPGSASDSHTAAQICPTPQAGKGSNLYEVNFIWLWQFGRVKPSLWVAFCGRHRGQSDRAPGRWPWMCCWDVQAQQCVELEGGKGYVSWDCMSITIPSALWAERSGAAWYNQRSQWLSREVNTKSSCPIRAAEQRRSGELRQ